MVDVDGVLIIHPDTAGWSVHLERDLGVSAKALHRHFFQVHWDEIIHGRAGLRERLTLALDTIAPNCTCDELIEYWFSNDAHVNLSLLRDLTLLRERGIEIHLATVQEHERARYLWDTVGFSDQFDGIHYAASLGSVKPDDAFYKKIEERSGFAPKDIFFIDDKIENVEGALNAGWSSAQWTTDARLQKLLPQHD